MSVNNTGDSTSDSSSMYPFLATIAVGMACAGYVYIKSQFETTPVVQKTKDIAKEILQPVACSQEAVDPNEILQGMSDIPPDLFRDIMGNISGGQSSFLPPRSLTRGLELSREDRAMLPPEALEEPHVVQAGLDITAFNEHNFSGNTELAQRSSRRLESICKFFGVDNFIPVRGDGNCFFNAAVAGLFNYIDHNPGKKRDIIDRLEGYRGSLRPYVLEDTNITAPAYSKGFYKEGDFELVIRELRDNAPEELVTKDQFTSAFARVLRYALNHSCEEEDVGQRSGCEVDMIAIWALNSLFGINAKLAVLEGASHADINGPSSFFLMHGDMAHSDQDIIDITRPYPIRDHEADFIIIRKSGHYFSGIFSL